MTQTPNKGDALIIWEDPYISANHMGEFIRKVPAKHKENIWSTHSNDGYIAECNLVQTLHSFTTLYMKMQENPTTPPTTDEMEDKLKPLWDAIVANIEDHDQGISEDEYNQIHEWILDTSHSNHSNQLNQSNRPRRRRKPPKSTKMGKRNKSPNPKTGKISKSPKMNGDYAVDGHHVNGHHVNGHNVNGHNVSYKSNVAPTTHSKRKLKGQRVHEHHGLNSTFDHMDDSMVSSKPRSHSNAVPPRSRKRKPKPVRSRKLKLKRERSESAAPTMTPNRPILSNVASSSSISTSYTSTASNGYNGFKPLQLTRSISVKPPKEEQHQNHQIQRIDPRKELKLRNDPSDRSNGSTGKSRSNRLRSKTSERPTLKVQHSTPQRQRSPKQKPLSLKNSKSAGRSRGNSPRKKNGRGRARTDRIMCTIKLGQTVRLVGNRVGYVRFKGKVKFSIGEWFGIEIFDIITKTRHNGTVFGKKYFNCPRNKGLFVKRGQILEIIKPQDIKKVLKELEREQLRQQRAEREKAREKKKKQNNKEDVMLTPALALYQQEIYGNHQLTLRVTNSCDDRKEEEAVKKHFRRFSRLGHHATRSPSIQLIVDPEALFNGDEDDDDDDDQKTPALSIVPDVDEFGGLEDIEYFQELFSNEDDGMFEIKLFGAFERYVSQFEVVMNKGIQIKQLNVGTKQGRAFVLEYGTGENEEWYIEQIENKNIKKMPREKVMKMLKRTRESVERGYTILLKQYQ